MNHLFFGAKMFHLASLRTTGSMLEEFGVTPARYDMLIAISAEPGGVAQANLRGILGVTGPTISRMLASLEELDLVIRTPHPRNARHNWVALTQSARHRLAVITEDLLESSLPFMVDEIFNPKPEDRDSGEAAIAEIDALLWRIREELGDFSSLRYPYDKSYGPLCPLRRARAVSHEEMRAFRRRLRARSTKRRSPGSMVVNPWHPAHELNAWPQTQRGGNVATPSFQM